MPPEINGRHGFGITHTPAATPSGGAQAPAGSRPSSPARPEGLGARQAPPQAGMAPRQRMPQAWQPTAMGVSVQPHAALHGAPTHRGLQPHGHTSSRGGIMSAARNMFQRIRQFPQEVQQLAQAASYYPPVTMSHAMHTVNQAIQGLHALSQQQQPHMHPQMPYAPMPYAQVPYAPAHGHAPAQAHGHADAPQQPAHGVPVHSAPPPVWGTPVGHMPPQPAPWHHPAPPMAVHPALQVQHSAHQFMAEAQAFDAAMLSHQMQQMQMNAQTVQNCMAELQQVVLANQALLAGAARPGQVAARAMM